MPWTMMLVVGVTCALRNAWMICSFIALIPHELGHIFAAKAVGAQMASLELMPFGAALRLAQPLDSKKSEFCIAAAGPLASVAVATLAAGVMSFFPDTQSWIGTFIGASLLLALANCVPALPLDGGRMLRASLGAVISPGAANHACCIIGGAAALAIAAIGCFWLWQGSLNVSLFMLASLLFTGAVSEWRNGAYHAATASMARRGSLRRTGAMPLKTVAVRAELPAREALKKLKGASLLVVLDDDLRLLGTLGEGDLLRGMAQHGSETPVRRLVIIDQRRRAW